MASLSWTPDISLPFDDYYTYLASVGTIAAIGSLFIEPTFLSAKVVFEMGAVSVAFGILGWVIDKGWKLYGANANVEWQHAIRRAGYKQSPYELMKVKPQQITVLISASRLLVVFFFLLTKWYVYPHSMVPFVQ